MTMNNPEAFIILILGAIAYQLYLLLKIANKKTEAFASEEHSTLYPVFTPREIQWQHDEYRSAQRLSEWSFDQLRKVEREELFAHKKSRKPVEEFKPSDKLIITIRSNTEHLLSRNNHYAHLQKMIEANIAALNGQPIAVAEKESRHQILPSMDLIRKEEEGAVAGRKEYWQSSFDTIVSDPDYAK